MFLTVTYVKIKRINNVVFSKIKIKKEQNTMIKYIKWINYQAVFGNETKHDKKLKYRNSFSLFYVISLKKLH